MDKHSSYYLTDMRDSFGIAILYQDQLRLFKEFITKKALGGLEQTAGRNDQKPLYPACRNQLETRRRYLEVLTEGLVELEIKTAYEASPGLCAPHLVMMQEPLKIQNSEIIYIISNSKN